VEVVEVKKADTSAVEAPAEADAVVATKAEASAAAEADLSDKKSQEAGPDDWDMIKEFRAQKCSERPDPAHHDPCLKFMEPICNPGGKDGPEGAKLDMDGEPGENGSGKGYCEAFYNNVNKQLCKEKGGHYCGEVKEDPPKEEKKAAPAEADEGDKKDSGAGDVSPDAWAADLAKDGGGSDHNPETLYDMQKHKDGKTTTSNWGAEYGPNAHGGDVEDICDEKPGNVWCKMHGDGNDAPGYTTNGDAGKSSGGSVTFGPAFFGGCFLLLLIVGIFFLVARWRQQQ
jgi:hypothetical protein